MRFVCPIECGPDAVIDAFGEKVPSWNNNCLRTYFFDAALVELPNGKKDYIVWKLPNCAKQSDLSLSIYCQYFVDENGVKIRQS